jgi:hypothetical protein
MQYNQASYKQSHNSYERNEDSHETLAFHSKNLGEAGCRGLEYDIWRHSDESNGRSLGYFTVAHSTPGDIPYANYLGYLLSWHLADPTHDVVFVSVDIKSKEGSKEKFPDEIDNYMKEWFSVGLLYKPKDLSPDSDDFVAHVKANGWPDVEALRGKFIFCLSGNEDWKSYYAKTSPRARLCFADIGFDDSKQVTLPTGGQRVIYSSNLYNAEYDTWKKSIATLRQANLIVRGYVLNGEDIWTHAKLAKLNIFATDKITGSTWAHVGDRPFVQL